MNRADDGEVRGFAAGGVPYFDAPPTDPGNVPPVSAAASSPNRLMAGPGMFGSLPTGVKANVPWQTLLFRPWLDPVTPRRPPHYGASWPQDHLLVEPAPPDRRQSQGAPLHQSPHPPHHPQQCLPGPCDLPVTAKSHQYGPGPLG